MPLKTGVTPVVSARDQPATESAATLVSHNNESGGDMPDLESLGNAAENIKDYVVEKGTAAVKAGAETAKGAVSAVAGAVSDATSGDTETDTKDYRDQ